MKYELIVATSLDSVIGYTDGLIPWTQKSDQKRFKEMTLHHTVVYGRKTSESLPFKGKAFPERDNIILTRNTETEFCKQIASTNKERNINLFLIDDINLLKADWIEDRKPVNDVVYIVGGAEIYKQALECLPISKIHHTLVHTTIGNWDCNVKFEIPDGWICDQREDHVPIDSSDMFEYSYLTWIPKSDYL